MENHYKQLNTNLRLCLQYFLIFPEDAVIKVRCLIYWWIAEGLVTADAENHKDADEVGKYHYKELTDKGFIEPVNKHSFSPFDSCRMNVGLSRILKSDAAIFSSPSFPHYFFNGELKSGIWFNSDLEYLKFKHGWLSRKKNIVVVQLGSWTNSATSLIEIHNTEFLMDLKDQKRLRYLSLRGIFGVKELPNSICGLKNLIILDLRACHSLERLPKGIKSMKKLTHLDMSECHLLENMPMGIQHLSELQVLKGFVINVDRENSSCNFKELVKLKKLRKLSIVLVRYYISTLLELKEMVSLGILTIVWGNKPLESDAPVPFSDGPRCILSLPKDLEKLELRCYPETVLPISGELYKLKRLYIKGGKLESLLPRNSDIFCNVEILRLKFLSKISMEWSELLQAFPKADYIENVQCPNLKSSPEQDLWERTRST